MYESAGPIRDFCVANHLAEPARQKRELPAREPAIHRLTKAEHRSRIDGNVALHQTLSLIPIGKAAQSRFHLRPEGSAQREIDHVAYTGRTVVEVIVVAVEPILRQCVPFDEPCERRSLSRREIQLLS